MNIRNNMKNTHLTMQMKWTNSLNLKLLNNIKKKQANIHISAKNH